MPHRSWILEVRQHLESPPPHRHEGPGVAHAAFVPLYVDGSDLWVLLSESERASALDWGTAAFLGDGLETGEHPWAVIGRICQRETKISTDHVLRLGELDEAETLYGFSVIPCVGAIPRPDDVSVLSGLELVALPLTAFQNPRLIEDRQVTAGAQEGWIRVYHIGRHRIAGTAAQILENLTRRLSKAVGHRDRTERV